MKERNPANTRQRRKRRKAKPWAGLVGFVFRAGNIIMDPLFPYQIN
jgi:hypothetical protein